jgi:hypothetical protein
LFEQELRVRECAAAAQELRPELSGRQRPRGRAGEIVLGALERAAVAQGDADLARPTGGLRNARSPKASGQS